MARTDAELANPLEPDRPFRPADVTIEKVYLVDCSWCDEPLNMNLGGPGGWQAAQDLKRAHVEWHRQGRPEHG
jgi:hypothetical protein